MPQVVQITLLTLKEERAKAKKRPVNNAKKIYVTMPLVT
jgi:hypothetical protein